MVCRSISQKKSSAGFWIWSISVTGSSTRPEAIADYEDGVFFNILAEELARRDMDYQPVSNDNYEALVSRMDDYIAEFEAHGTDNISIPDMDLP